MSSFKQTALNRCFADFNGPDSAVSVPPANTGQVWQTLGAAVYGISANMMYRVAGTSGRAIKYQDIGLADCVIKGRVIVDSLNGQGGVAFRIKDINNFLYARIESDSVVIYKFEKDAGSTLAAYWAEPGSFTEHEITLELKGPSIKLFVDGIRKCSVRSDFNKRLTKHGFFTATSNNTTKLDYFSIEPYYAVKNYTLEDGFENSLKKFWTGEYPAGALSFSSDNKKSGNYSLRVELNASDPNVAGSKRAEIKLPPEPLYEEHWYAVSIYLPGVADGVEDYVIDTGSSELILQWRPDSDLDVQPTLSLRTRPDGHYWLYGLAVRFDLGAFGGDKGKWIDWLFHVKWAAKTTQRPVLEVYKKGIKVFTLPRGAVTATSDPVYLKLGIYKWDWAENNNSTITQRVVYYDDFVIR